jgi:hypothetical protein
MKGDFTRLSYRPNKHYTNVLKQQGRVDLDSDWNEHVQMQEHLGKMRTLDIIGEYGCPENDDGFEVDFDPNVLNSFIIKPGRIYIGGILCELGPDNQTPPDGKSPFYGWIDYRKQSDYPKSTELEPIEKDRIDLVYLDVWQRHVTVIEDPDIRERALGGPDTTTRVKTICQVKVLPNVEVNNCEDPIEKWNEIIKPSGARLSIGLNSYPTSIDPLLGEYSGLENRLYRVEIHDSGEPLVWPRPAFVETTDITVESNKNQAKINKDSSSSSGHPWMAGQLIEVFNEQTDSKKVPGELVRIKKVADGVLTLDSIPKNVSGQCKMRRVSTFKWSRDNGSVAFSIEQLAPAGDNTVKVKTLGWDQVLTIKEDDWVEVTDDAIELSGAPGTVTQVLKIDLAQKVLTLSKDISGIDLNYHAKVRRWDQRNDVEAVTTSPRDLDHGIQITFAGSNFKTGDFWTYAIRTNDKKLETLDKSFAPPQGIEHHYCKLALISWQAVQTGTGIEVKGTKLCDCRKLFAQLNEPKPTLYYVGGDGQEAKPGQTLPKPLQVGVSNGIMPVANAGVKFELKDDGSSGSSILPDNKTGSDGIAKCKWTLGKSAPGYVKASLMDPLGNELGLPIFFSANLSEAADVAYSSSMECPVLSESKTVQEAIDELCKVAVESTIFYLGGDGQEARAGQTLPKPLQVGVSNGIMPVANARIKFELKDDGGSGSSIMPDDKTGSDGIAKCIWTLGKSAPGYVKATLRDSLNNQVGLPILFSASLSDAAEVAYDPKYCPTFKDKGIDNVQNAITELCLASMHEKQKFFIKDINISDSANNEKPLSLYDEVPLDRFLDGIRILCSEEVDSDSVCRKCGEEPDPNFFQGYPVILVTLYLPYPLNKTDRSKSMWDIAEGTLFNQPITIFGRLDVDGNVIIWAPNELQKDKLRYKLFTIVGTSDLIKRILVNFEIKGNLIRSKRDPDVYLDGDAFMAFGKPHNLKSPIGDGRPGGNLEMWFWITKPG